jgi:catechol 2,3-dioxygenase-like lactoylglutathione lyase family enzyme
MSIFDPPTSKPRAFYERVLGLTVGARPPFQSTGYWMYLGDHPIVHLVQRPSSETPASGPGNLDHVGFAGVDLEGTRAQLQAGHFVPGKGRAARWQRADLRRHDRTA